MDGNYQEDYNAIMIKKTAAVLRKRGVPVYTVDVTLILQN